MESTYTHESFNIASFSREDIASLGFDTTNISDETMETIARRLHDDYLEQMFWLSLGIISEIEGIHPFRTGDRVRWHDPAEHDYSEEDLKIQHETVYTILKIRDDTALISCGVGEAEVFLKELEYLPDEN